jgi:hypothetical protein
VLQMQKDEANANFCKFITKNYESWLNDPNIDKPILSHQLLRKKLLPQLSEHQPTFLLLIDNLRYDQWKVLESLIAENFNVDQESTYFSILPTTTAFARNAIFAGVMPSEMEKLMPGFWSEDEDEGAKNNFEKELLQAQLAKNRLNIKFSYHKVIHAAQGKAVVDSFSNLLHNALNVVVFNFVDMLSHARTDTEMIRELAPDEAAYRFITQAWFQHSPLADLLRKIAEKKCRLVITTDHGTIRTKRPYRIVGDRNTNTNLRYKQGKNLDYDKKNVYVARKPEALHLPRFNVSTSYVFAMEDFFFAYPNNYNHYVKYYKDTFQHGGISLEEVIIPYIELSAK